MKDATERAQTAEAKAEIYKKEIVEVSEQSDPVGAAAAPVSEEGLLVEPIVPIK
ncbi:MAG: hypothetical protein AB7J13_10020 [Pyrinomonadaceae bacterium]